MNKLFFRILALFCVVSLIPAVPAAASGEAYAAHTVLCAAPYGTGPADVSVLVVTEDPARASLGEADVASEIRFFPFDAESGLYAAGAGEPAGSRVEILYLSDDRCVYTVRLTEPGKYTLSGAPYYILDASVPALASLQAELDEAVESSYGNTDAATAGKLHDWLCAKVSPRLPEDQPDLAAACTDPMNALLSGFASREGYARLYWLLLRAANIRSIVVSGQAGEEEATWNLCRLDDSWSWTDCAMDDAKDSRQKKYLQLDDAKIAKDHTLCPADAAFVESMIRPAVIDRLLDGTLPFELTRQPQNSDRRIELVYFDGPAFVIGDSATVTWHDVSNYDVLGQTEPAKFVELNMLYSVWLEEDHYYCSSDPYMAPEKNKVPVVSDPSELFTIDDVSDDLSSFTVTFRKPGLYSFYNETNFWLISPEQTELVELAGKIDKAVEAAKSSTEKETAKKLLSWLCGRVAYDYSFGEDPQSMVADFEPMTALIYGKCVCSGYAGIYNMLMKQAGIASLQVNGAAGDSGGHSWNICRYDGIWSHTDPTWSDPRMNYFALTPAQIAKDHTAPWAYDYICFSDPFTLRAAQFETAYRPVDCIPSVLENLPSDISEYGFPKKDPGFIRFTKAYRDSKSKSLVFEMDRKAYHAAAIKITGKNQESNSFRYGASNSTKLDCPATSDRLKLYAASYDIYNPVKKPSVKTIVYYKQGQWSDAAYTYLVPMKKNEIRGYSEKSCRSFEYDGDMNPVSASWRLVNDSTENDITVFFSPEGKAERFSVSCTPADGSAPVSWEAASDGTLIAFNGKAVEDPASVDTKDWERISFR